MNLAELSNIEIADLCRELALLLHAGVSIGDGLALLAEEEKDSAIKAMLGDMSRQVDSGAYLAQAFDSTGRFPAHMTGLIQVGEKAGRTEDALNALARYYENKERTERQITGALTYPVILLMLMLVVIVVLLSKVLPVFNEVYASLGGQLTGLAGGLLLLGQVLDSILPLLCAIMAAVLLILAGFALHRGFRKRLLTFWQKHWGDRGISRSMNNAAFAQALSMGISSGMPPEEAVEFAAALLTDAPKAAERCKECSLLLQQGESLSAALGKTDFMEQAACRLLTLGLRSGSGDSMMEELARRLQDDAQQRLERAAAKIEPTLVLVTSLLVGAILLAVMLPLMNIMSIIG